MPVMRLQRAPFILHVLHGSGGPEVNVETAVLFFFAHLPEQLCQRREKGRTMRQERQERRGRHAVGGTVLPLYEWIIDLYAPYVFVRCAGFTNDRSQALMIGAYTLITTCLMADRLDHLGQLGISIDVIAEVVGPDTVGDHGDDAGRRGCGELLIAEDRMRELAEGLNFLERPMREALVLHYVRGLTAEDMARVLNRSAAEIATRLARGERLLAGHLGGLRADGGETEPCDVRSLLAQFEAGLDAQWVREVRDCAIGYLARCDVRTGPRGRPWHLN